MSATDFMGNTNTETRILNMEQISPVITYTGVTPIDNYTTNDSYTIQLEITESNLSEFNRYWNGISNNIPIYPDINKYSLTNYQDT
jgi:hypothetical protein